MGKKYLLVEVCSPDCPFITDEIDNFCLLEKELVLCRMGKCPHGKTIEEMADMVNKEAKRYLCGVKVELNPGGKDFAFLLVKGFKALLGGGGK